MDEASRFTSRSLRMDGPELPLARSIPRLEVPVHFFQGRQDHVTPGVCVVRYYERLEAPDKRLVWFEESAHFPFMEEPKRFHAEMLKVAKATAG
jgi:pimeloyl-ACP methyl ester carboxylesterase